MVSIRSLRAPAPYVSPESTKAVHPDSGTRSSGQRRKQLAEMVRAAWSVDPLEARHLLAGVTLSGIPDYIQQGPMPAIDNGNVSLFGNDAVSGAVSAIAPDPFNANRVFIASINGGIFRALDATDDHPDWEALTDQFPSLSTRSLMMSPLNTNVLFAGLGRNSSSNGDGGTLDGLLRTTDGGNTWKLLGQRIFNLTTNGLDDDMANGVDDPGEWLSINNIVPTRITTDGTVNTQVVLAAAAGPNAISGVYRSTDGGVNWTNVSTTAGSGLMAAAVTSLVPDPTDQNVFFAAIPGQGIFRTNNAGQTWTNITPATPAPPLDFNSASRILLAAGGVGAKSRLYVSLLGVQPAVMTGARIGPIGFFWSATKGASWNTMALPGDAEGGVNPGGQGNRHYSMLVDRVNPDLIYVGGDRDVVSPFGARIFRGNTTTNSWEKLVDEGAEYPLLGGTFPHADSRAMAFDAAGTLLEANDGGIVRLIVDGPVRYWESMDNILNITEVLSAAWDSNHNTILVGTQDVGTSAQPDEGELEWESLLAGDGGHVEIEQRSDALGTYSAYYFSSQNFGQFQVLRVRDGAPDTANMPNLDVAGTGMTLYQVEPNLPFTTEYRLNNVAGGRLLIGTNTALYESTDGGDNLFNILTVPSQINAISYGGAKNGNVLPDVIWAAWGSTLQWRAISGNSFLNTSYAGGTINDIVVDRDDWQTVYVADAAGKIWRTTDGSNFTDITGNLASLTADIRTIEMTYALGQRVLVVGGRRGVYRRLLNPSPGLLDGGPAWTEYGGNLPNAVVTDVRYDSSDDLLLVGTLGRGTYKLEDVRNSIFAPGIVTIDGDDVADQNDNIILRVSPDNPTMLDILINGPVVRQVPMNIISEIHVNGLGGQDTLTLDFTNGNFIPLDNGVGGATGIGLVFDGGSQLANPGDRLTIIGGGGAITGAYTPSGNTPGSGIVRVGSAVLSFSDLEPVTVSGFASFNFVTPNSHDVVTISSVSPGTGIITGTSAGVVFENLTFSAIGTLNVDLALNNFGNANDILNLDRAGLVGDPAATINILYGAGSNNDVLNYDAMGQDVFINNNQTLTAVGSQPALIANVETVNLTNPARVTVTASSSGNTLTVNAATPTSGNMQLDSGPVINFNTIGALTYDALGGSDTLVINNPGGTIFAPANGILYNGGGQFGDSLTLSGGGSASFSETYAVGPGNGDGTITFSGPAPTQLVFTGLSPITDTVSAATLLVIATDAANNIQLDNGTSFGDGLLRVTIDLFEPIEFKNKSALVIQAHLSGADLPDNVVVNYGEAASGLTALTINTGAGADVVAINGSPVGVVTTISGGSEPDLITVGALLGVAVTVFGDGGNDTIFAGAGSDSLVGGDGRDVILGHAGNDTISGGNEDDFIRGGTGNDVISAGAGADAVYGEEGNDLLSGDAGGDRLDGGEGNDTVFGFASSGTDDNAADTISGRAGNDSLVGGGGPDWIDGGAGIDTALGNDGDDTILGGGGVGDSLVGGLGNDLIIGSDEGSDSDPNFGDAIFFGDIIDGGAGNDTINGLCGADRIIGGTGNDVIDTGTGGDSVSAGDGDDFVYAGQNALAGDRIDGEIGSDTIFGSNVDDTISGGDGNDSIVAQGGVDSITGDAGDDIIDSGAGSGDSVSGGTGNDQITDSGGANNTIHGDGGDDTLTGSNDGSDSILGGDGRDRIFGRAGNDTLGGGIGNDTIYGNAGDDLITGDAGADLLLGGEHHDTLYGHSVSGAGDDNAVDSLYGDLGSNGNEAGSGRDVLFGQGGNDLHYGEGDLDSIVAGGGANNLISYGPGGSTTPEAYVAPGPTAPPSIVPVPPITYAQSTLPIGVDYRGRWTELASSASNGGLSNSNINATEPSIAIAADGTKYVAWVDGRNGNYEVYVAKYTAGGGWQQLAGSAEEGGISKTSTSSRKPSITIGGDGNPVVAWTEITPAGSDIHVARFDGAAWVAMGTSLGAGGISGTGVADRAVAMNTAGGVVVAWLNTTAGIANVYARLFTGGTWQEFGGIGSASGSGISANVAGVLDFAAATDGTKVGITWSALDGGSIKQIYLREFGGVSWAGLGTSFGGSGLSNTADDSASPTIAYFGGSPFVAWQDLSSGLNEIYVARYDGAAWVAAGPTLNTSNTHGDATAPRLASSAGGMRIAWSDDTSASNIDTGIAIYSMRWTGTTFAPELATDTTGIGVASTRNVADVAIAVNPAGQASIAVGDATSTARQVLVRSNDFVVGNVFNAGGATSVQSVLDGNALGSGSVILVTGSSAGFTVSAADAGVTIIGMPGATITGAVTINAGNVTIQRLTITGTLAINAASFTVRDSTLAAAEVNGVADTQIAGNTTGLLTIGGGAGNSVIEHNTIAGVTIGAGGATSLTLVDNTITATVALANAASGSIRQNRMSSSGTVLNITAAFTGAIEQNNISNGTVGVNYAASAMLSGNRIFNNGTGITSNVAGIAALGFVGVTSPNHIFNNGTGVILTNAGMQNQHIYSNTTGVSGSGTLGGSSLDLANLIELNTTGVNFTGPIQYNRIARNTTGIAATSNQVIVHNLIYRNTQYGVRASARSNVRIFSNSFYTASGDNIRLDGSSTDVQIINNILVTEGGYDIYVDPNSRAGYFSDYNLLQSAGTGQIVRWLKDFNDILDWQSDVALYDLHSVGHTSIDPLRPDPGFMNVHWDDFRLFGLAGGQRASNVAIDAGTSLADIGVDIARTNLLANPSFESGVSGWTVNLGGTTQASNPTPWDGAAYFYPASVALGSAEQVINLLTAGYSAGQLDSQDLVLSFGGRVRTVGESMQIVLTFLDGSSAAIGSPITVSARNVGDRWELLGDKRAIPLGTRSVRFRFESTRQVGTTNDSYLDGAFVYVESENNAPDLGAYGNTPLDVAQIAPPHLALRSPDLYTDLILTQPIDITWDSFGNAADSSVRIDLYQDSADGPAFLLNITPGTSDTGHFTWIPQSSGLTAGLTGLRIQLSLVGDNITLDRAAETSTVPQAGTSYFIDDASNTNDEYTPGATGSNRNTGKLATAPKPLLTTLLRIYDLNPSDTVFVDTGSYQHFTSLTISGAAGVGDDEGILITGPVNALNIAQISPLGFTTGALIDINQGDFTTLTRLSLGGGTQYGLWIRNNSTNNTATHITQTGATLDGIRVESDSSPQFFGNLDVSFNGRTGVSVASMIGGISNSRFYNNTQFGLQISSASANAVFESNEAFGNTHGMAITTSAPVGTPVIIGNADLSQGKGNKVYNNTTTGIFVAGNVIVAGNIVYGQGGSNAHGIEMQGGAVATKNIIHSNVIGVYGGSATFNRIYNNSSYGIYSYNFSGPILGNAIYSNGVGIVAPYATNTGGNGPDVRNNIIYANATRGLWIIGGLNATIYNNTFYQPLGDAIYIEQSNGSINTGVRNNVLHVGSGYAIRPVDTAAQAGLVADYNLFFTTGGAKVGFWAGQDRATLAAWSAASLQDQNSLFGDPLYVDFDGADNLLGFTGGVDRGEDDNFHEKSPNGSIKNGSLVPVLNVGTGLPVEQLGSYSNDAAPQSPVIDRGDGTFAFVNEPATNGGFVNLGAYGNTSQASKSPGQYTLVLKPNGGETGVTGQNFTINWRQENLGSSTVMIELVHQAGLTLETVISAAAANTGSFVWSIPGGIPAGSDYLIRITRNDVPAISDLSDAVFAIAAPTPIYYVNDSGVDAGDWTTAPGNDANDGLTPATPKASLQAILTAYDLGPGDTIRVDRGVYNLTTNIIIDQQDSGVEIVGFIGADQTSQWSTSVLADGPTHYYRLGDSSTTTASDSSGNANHGTYVGGTTLDSPGALPGSPDTAASFDGVDDRVTLPSGFANFPNGFSFETWVYPTTVGSFQSLFDLGNGQANNNIVLYRSGGSTSLVFQVYNGASAGASVTAANALLSNQWQHIAVTLTSAGAAKIYRNGLLLASGNINVPVNVVRTSNFLARDNFPNARFAGRMDEAAFYDKVLTDSQIFGRFALTGGSVAVINRANAASGVGIELTNADNVTISGLGITGAQYGIRLIDASDSDGVTLIGNDIFGNATAGIYAGASNDGLLITQNRIHGNFGGFGADGITLNNAVGVVISDNDIFANTRHNVVVTGNNNLVTLNRIYAATNRGVIASGSFNNPVNTISFNDIHDNAQIGVDIAGTVVVKGNTIYNHTANSGYGLLMAGGEARDNVIYNSIRGITVGNGVIIGNRIFNNSLAGIECTFDAIIESNQIYNNGSGITATRPTNAGGAGPYIRNNLVYQNTIVGIRLDGGLTAEIIGNTVYQPTGNGIALNSNLGTFKDVIKNNIVVVGSGIGLAIANVVHTGLVIDYNDVFVTGAGNFASYGAVNYPTRGPWYFELGYDQHSISSDPQFVDIDGADDQLGFVGGVDYGADDNFALMSGSPAIDKADPTSYFLVEPQPSGGRANLGHHGNTALATPSTTKTVQVLIPDGLDKLTVGVPFNVQFLTSGLAQSVPVALINAGGTTVAPWLNNAYATSFSFLSSVANVIDVSAVSNPAPQLVYQQFIRGVFGINQLLSYKLPVLDGSYTLRLHFMEPEQTTAGARVMDVKVNGATLTSNFDPFVAAGNLRFKASTLTYNVAASGGSGLSLDLVSKVSNYAILSAIELTAATPSGSATPRANIDVSLDNGANWAPVATDVPIDVNGRGSFLWTPTTSAAQALIRVTDVGSPAFDISDSSFLIVDSGPDYYINDGSTVGDIFTTAIGNDLNTGRSPSQPMRNLSALLAAYDLGPGDVIHVDTGTYTLLGNVTFDASDSGVRIEGPQTGPLAATFDRGNSSSVAFDLNGIDDLTLDRLRITGAMHGITNTVNTNVSDNLVISNSEIFGNASAGIYLIGGAGNLMVTGTTLRNNFYGMYFSDSQHTASVTGNTFHNNTSNAVYLVASSGTVSGNMVFNNGGQGGAIDASGFSGIVTISGNTVYNNPRGIWAGSFTITTGNTVYASTDPTGGAGITGASSFNNTITNNVVYGTNVGISGGGLVSGNRVFNNFTSGIDVFTNTASGNIIYSNGIGVRGLGGFASQVIRNNLIYANVTAGIKIFDAYTPVITNNTIYQPTGDGIRIEITRFGVPRTIRSNIIQVNSGYALWLDNEVISDLVSDYNTLYTTGSGKLGRAGPRDFTSLAQWFYESRQDQNSLTSNPMFIDADGADNLLGFSGGVDHGLDDNFLAQPASPTIDAGDPGVPSLAEPAPNGNRINQGHTGNTPQAASSPGQIVQILSPNGFEKLEAGNTHTIKWRGDGLNSAATLALLNLSTRPNGTGLGNWQQGDQYGVVVPLSSWTSAVVNTSGVTNPGPLDMYQSYSYANTGVGNLISYKLPASDGDYTLRLHWSDPGFGTGNQFDVKINGAVVQANYNVYVAAGNASNKAVALSIPVTVSGGTGILLELVNKTTAQAFLCGMELTAANPLGIANPTAMLEYSTDNGGSWQPIATGLPMDLLGNGSYDWTVPGTLSTQVLVRVTAEQGSLPTDVSNNTLQIVNNGIHYYVNDGSLSGDVFSTALGDNLNSGKSPDKPMASLASLLYDYDLEPGDVIHVDAGTYNLLRNSVLLPDDSGVRIEGPTGATPATHDRGTQIVPSASIIQFRGADNVTVTQLKMLNGYHGVEFGVYNGAADSDNNVISNNDISQMGISGVMLFSSAEDNNTITGNAIHDIPGNGVYGIYANGTGTSVTGNVISNVGANAIHLVGVNNTASGNTLFGNRFGIVIASNNPVVSGNIVRNNTEIGIVAGSFVNALVSGNIVFANPTGIITTGTPLVGNRVFASANFGIDASGNTQIRGNQVYSNATGLRFSAGAGQILSNLVYANTTRGISVESSTTGTRIWNNTVYSIVGDGVRLLNSSNVNISNNILWVNAGSAIFVSDATSQTGLVSDRNLFNGTGNVGSWNGVVRTTLADWQAAGSKDPNSIFADPLFVDLDGADNVLGYRTVPTVFDGGSDDNFFLTKLSPAIDRGHSWNAAHTDFYGGLRADDPGTPNTGTTDYFTTNTGSSQFSATGTPRNWRSANTYFSLVLPFSFPYFGTSYTTAYVGTNGLLQLGSTPPFGTPVFDSNNSLAQFAAYPVIAPLWDSLSTFANASDDIFTDTTVPNQVTIRWNATNLANGADAQFALVLFSDGTIRFDYGPGNTGLSPTIGISGGNGQAYHLAPHDGQATLTNANSIQFNLAAGIGDLGAIEFRGSSNDVSPPAVVSTTPAAVHSSGTTLVSPNQIVVNFGESLNRIDAAAVANFDLRSTGPDLAFDTGDDILFALTPLYTEGDSFVTLLAGLNLPDGTYRLTIRSNSADNTGVHDSAGILLDGDSNASAGGNYSRTFTINVAIAPPQVLDISFAYDAPGPRVIVQFSKDVSATLTTADLVLQNLTTQTTIPAANILLDYNPATHVATFTFTGLGTLQLPDGNYHAHIAAASVTDTLAQPLTTDVDLDFFVLAGDIDRNRVVDLRDLYVVSLNWLMSGKTFSEGDVNYDGLVNKGDLTVISQNWQTELTVDTTPPAAPVGSFEYQNSPNKVMFTFAENVSAGLSIGSLVVTTIPGGAPIVPTAYSYDMLTNTATWTLPVSLANGRYHATFVAGSIKDSNGNALTDPVNYDFFVLAGDIDRDGLVDLRDLYILSQSWLGSGMTWAQGDFTGDGIVNKADLTVISQNWQVDVNQILLPAAPAPTAPVVPARPATRQPARIQSQAQTSATAPEPPPASNTRSATRIGNPPSRDLLNNGGSM